MKLFTFSGIRADITGFNDGRALVAFVREIIDALPATQKPSYSGTENIDHFRSQVNFGRMMSHWEGIFTLDGSPTLNEEAINLSPTFGETIFQQTLADPSETVLFLSHSQGTNNLTFSLNWLIANRPDFFRNRKIRCAYFDPKVGINPILNLFSFDNKAQAIEFLFFQSECDILGNQSLIIPKFIDQFPHGNHIWVKGLDHSSICDWDFMNLPQKVLTLSKYSNFRRKYTQTKIKLEGERSKGGLGPNQIIKLSKFVSDYPMLTATPADAILGFLQGKLPKKFLS